jgi:hypothetical protein
VCLSCVSMEVPSTGQSEGGCCTRVPQNARDLTLPSREKMRLLVTHIPRWLYDRGDLTWIEYLTLKENLDGLVCTTHDQIHQLILHQNFLHYFKRSIDDQVRDLLYRKHKLVLLQQDENELELRMNQL